MDSHGTADLFLLENLVLQSRRFWLSLSFQAIAIKALDACLNNRYLFPTVLEAKVQEQVLT